MSIRRLSLTVLAVAAMAGCGGSPVATGVPQSSAPASTSGAPAASAPTTGSPAQPAAGGGATDFCSAFKEYRSATQEDTAKAQGAGYRAAATDMRAFAPADIKAAAGLAADVIDEVGLAILGGQPAPELIGQGQSPERIQALADVSSWVTKNCA